MFKLGSDDLVYFMWLIVVTLTSCRCFCRSDIEHFDVDSIFTAGKQAVHCTVTLDPSFNYNFYSTALITCIVWNGQKRHCYTAKRYKATEWVLYCTHRLLTEKNIFVWNPFVIKLWLNYSFFQSNCYWLQLHFILFFISFTCN